MAINWDKVKKQAEEQEKTGRTTRGKGVYNNNAAAAPKRDAGVPAIADAPADVYGGVFDVNPDSFATEATGKAKPSAARNAVLSGLAGTGSSLSKNTSLLLGGMAQGREDAAEHITTPAWLTKGSIYANRGYDPMNPERSEQETRNLQAASALANEMARDLRAKEQMLDAQAKENLGAVGTAAYDLTKMGTQIVGDAVANRLLPGAGLLSMGQRSFGQGVMAAEDEGITGTRAIAYGAGTAAIEMATEKISAIAKPLKAIYGKGLVDDMIQNLTKTAKGNRVLSVLGSAAGEGAEEAIASVLQVPLQNITLQNGAAYDAQWLADTAYEALLGGLMGGAFGVASIPGEIAQERRNNAVQQLAEEMARESMQNATQSAPAPMQTAEQAHMPAENKMAQRAIQTAKAASVEDAASQFGEAGAQVYKAGYRDTGDDAQYFGDFYKAYQAGMRGEAAPKSSLTDTETAAAHAAGVSDAKRSAQAAYFGKDSQLVRDDKWKKAHLPTKDSRKLDALAKVLGVKIRFVDSIDETVQNELGDTEIHKSVANAQYSNGEILLALDAENPVMVSVVHEAVHRLRETTPAEYASLVQFVQNNMSGGALNWAINRRGADYKGADRTELTEEVVADAFGQLINDTALLDQFVKDNRTVAEKLLDSIRDMINAIKRALNKQNLQLTAEQRKEFQDLYDNLYEAEKLLGNALNVSAETVEKRGAQEYTGDKETKHSRKDSADHGIEENRRHAIEVLRGSGTLKWSQINEEKRIAYERRSAFAGRIAKAGAVEKTVGNVLYGYRPVPVSAASKYAREVIEELRKFGINDAFVFEGEVQANHLGKTISDAAECMTLLDGAIGIKDEAKMDAKNVAAHEAIHYKKKKGDPDVVTYEETVINNVDLSSDLFQKYYDAINDTYFSGGLDWGNQKDVAKFVDEFSAYVGGHLYSGAFDVSGMFVDMAEVVPALEKSLGVTLSTQSNIAAEQAELSDVNVKFSLRKKEPPKNVGIAYKVFYAKNGQLYPPMVANPGGEGTPVGVWLDADVGVAAAPSKTGRPQVKAGGKGTQGGSGSLAFRPGWHLGDLPLATQFARKNPETGAKDLFPADFVWAECEYAMDKDYQEEAMSYGYTENGKFRHSYAGLPRLPEDGYYRYRTNPNPDTIPWVITGAMRVKRILTDAETDKILRDAGVEPMKRQGGELDLERLGLTAGDVENINVSVDVNTHSAYPKLSRKTWTASSYVTDREKAIQQLARDLGVSEKRAANYIDDVNSVARQIADDRIRLDYESNIDETASVIKPNSEYKWSVDMSTLCAKRLLFTGTFDEIQRALPNTVFTSEDLVRLRTMMMERDLEVACGICYVESTRREMGPITQAFIDQYKESQRTGKPITRLNSEGETVELKKTKDQMKTTRDKTTDRFYADKNYTPTLADLNTTDIDFVKRDHPLVYEAYLNYMNARGQAKPKLLETRAEYKGEILRHFRSKTVVDALNRRGGLRIQSFSDFEVPHMIDMMQILLDMSRVGLKSQAYTKVPAFAAVFGNTGMKINLSLIAKGDGLDANGNLIFDDVEGINHEEAFKLRKMYSENVGTILVGKNDAHIIKAMADPRIDFIIPFHKSSWKESLYDALGLTGYEDYTDTQNEKPIDKKRKIKNFDPSEYWDFSKSGDENAQIYLEKCREDGRIPKFPQFQSYPGYWKLLIDFKMYDNEGNGAKQRVVTPDFNMIEANKILEAYEGGHRSFPVAKDVVKDFVAEYKTRRSRKGMSIEEYIEKYGPIPAGEKPYREVSVPRKTGEKEKVSQTVRTVMEAEATPDEMIHTIEELVAEGEFSYERYSDKGAMAGATRTIKSKGFETALADWLSEVKQGKVSKRNTALGWALYNNCANSGDTKSAMTILTAMVEHQRSAAQALQATRILKKMSPTGQLYGVQRSISNLQSELREKFGDKAPNLTISKYLADKFMDAKTQKERDEVMEEIYKDIGRQMPNSFMDKWRAWRYLAMLGNPRTHVRNIVGNAGFAPMVWTKDLVATGIEAVAGKASGGKMGRTKALPSAELISAAAADFPNAQKKILEGGKYNESEINDAIEEGRVIFKTRVLEKARVGNRKLMEQEDLWFSKGHYAIALAQYCKANSISAQHIRSGKLSDYARAYAIKEAQKATYRDTNAFSEFVSNMGRYHGNNPVGKAGSLLVEGVLPFRKTPANILVRGLEYSPAGFLKGLTWDLWMVRKHAKNPDEGITAAEAIDHISAGFVGTQLVALGAFGAMMGVLRGSGGDDEDQKKFDELQGHQAYSLELEAIDTSVTLDWLAPEVLPLFIGVNIAEEAMRSKEDITMSDLMAAIGNVTAPMLTMSCLSGLNELFESVSYATNEGIAALPKIAMSASTSLITQAIPTLAGQIERTAQENDRMTTYTDKNNRWLTPDMQYSIGRASSRTPGWDFNQIPYIDAWGRQEVDTNRWVRGLNNFLNPAYVSKIEGGAMEEELQRLYDATGEAKVLPDRAAKYFTVNEKRKDLTAQEYVKYATAKGQKSYELVSKLTANRSWKSLSDAEKVEAISKAYEYANAVAKTKVSPYKLEGANAKIRNSGNDTLYIMAWAAQTDVDNGLKRDGETISNSKSLLQMEAMYALPAIANMDANKRKELFLSIGVGKTVAGYSKDTVKSELGKMRKTAD